MKTITMSKIIKFLIPIKKYTKNDKILIKPK